MINVLDKGFIRLVDSMGNDLSIVRAARVSYNAEWRAGENEKSDARLVNYLWQNKHTTPFEAVEFQFEIKAPIFVVRQWHRHRTWSYNEVSARYMQLPEEFYIPDSKLIGKQHSSNKQMRTFEQEAGISLNSTEFITNLQQHSAQGYKLYSQQLAAGIPRELARLFLGLNTYTHFFGKVNLLNLLRFLTLRSHSHAQYEIQVYALAIVQLIEPIVPITISAWRHNSGEP